MKISAERLKKIIKEEVQHVREMPMREATNFEQGVTEDNMWKIHAIVKEAAFQISGEVNPDDPTDQVGSKYSEQLDPVVTQLEAMAIALSDSEEATPVREGKNK